MALRSRSNAASLCPHRCAISPSNCRASAKSGFCASTWRQSPSASGSRPASKWSAARLKAWERFINRRIACDYDIASLLTPPAISLPLRRVAMNCILSFALARLPEETSAARGLATLSLAVALGMGLGSIRIRGIRLGVSGVLFSALIFGQIGLTVDARVLGFLRDFALIIFIYCVGLQVGPSFLTSLRAEGLRLNLLSIAAIVLGAVFTGTLVNFFGPSIPWPPGVTA